MRRALKCAALMCAGACMRHAYSACDCGGPMMARESNVTVLRGPCAKAFLKTKQRFRQTACEDLDLEQMLTVSAPVLALAAQATPAQGLGEIKGGSSVEEEAGDVLMHRMEVGVDGDISGASSRIVHTGAAVMSVLGLRCVRRRLRLPTCMRMCCGHRGHVRSANIQSRSGIIITNGRLEDKLLARRASEAATRARGAKIRAFNATQAPAASVAQAEGKEATQEAASEKAAEEVDGNNKAAAVTAQHHRSAAKAAGSAAAPPPPPVPHRQQLAALGYSIFSDPGAGSPPPAAKPAAAAPAKPAPATHAPGSGPPAPTRPAAAKRATPASSSCVQAPQTASPAAGKKASALRKAPRSAASATTLGMLQSMWESGPFYQKTVTLERILETMANNATLIRAVPPAGAGMSNNISSVAGLSIDNGIERIRQQAAAAAAQEVSADVDDAALLEHFAMFADAADGAGKQSLSPPALEAALRALQVVGIEGEEVEEVRKRVDVNGDRLVNFDEFRLIFRRCIGRRPRPALTMRVEAAEGGAGAGAPGTSTQSN